MDDNLNNYDDSDLRDELESRGYDVDYEGGGLFESIGCLLFIIGFLVLAGSFIFVLIYEFLNSHSWIVYLFFAFTLLAAVGAEDEGDKKTTKKFLYFGTGVLSLLYYNFFYSLFNNIDVNETIQLKGDSMGLWFQMYFVFFIYAIIFSLILTNIIIGIYRLISKSINKRKKNRL